MAAATAARAASAAAATASATAAAAPAARVTARAAAAAATPSVASSNNEHPVPAPVVADIAATGEGHRLTTLDCGVRVVTERMDSVRSVAAGRLDRHRARVGEPAEQAGLSHLIEHMLFRGTDRYASLEIDQLFDAMGAELNAGTGKETTSVFARVLDRHLDRALDVMADMVWRPQFDPRTSTPSARSCSRRSRCTTTTRRTRSSTCSARPSSARTRSGARSSARAEVVGSVDAATRCTPSTASATCPRNVVVAAAGSVDHDALVDARRGPPAFERTGATAPLPPDAPAPQAGTVRFVAKETEQYHVCLGAPGIARDDERRFALRVLDNDPRRHVVLAPVPGGAREARPGLQRLHVPVAVRRHRARSACTSARAPTTSRTALGVVGDELDRFRGDPASPDELERAKENVKGRVVLALESTHGAHEPPRRLGARRACRC